MKLSPSVRQGSALVGIAGTLLLAGCAAEASSAETTKDTPVPQSTAEASAPAASGTGGTYKDGTYTGTFKPTQSGEYHLSPTLNDQEIEHSPFRFAVTAGPPSAGHTFAIGEGLSEAESGEPAMFFVQSVDSYGNEIKTGGAKVTASLKPQDSKEADDVIVADVADNGDGIYTATYVPTKEVLHTLDIKLDDSHIKNSPFAVNVIPGKASPEHSAIIDAGTLNFPFFCS